MTAIVVKAYVRRDTSSRYCLLAGHERQRSLCKKCEVKVKSSGELSKDRGETEAEIQASMHAISFWSCSAELGEIFEVIAEETCSECNLHEDNGAVWLCK